MHKKKLTILLILGFLGSGVFGLVEDQSSSGIYLGYGLHSGIPFSFEYQFLYGLKNNFSTGITDPAI